MQTYLEAVNTLLAVINEAPVMEIDDDHPDVQSALNAWNEFSREIQGIGWWYNQETWQLIPQTNGEVGIPSNVLQINGPSTNYVKRSGKLYDLENHTYDLSLAGSSDLLITFTVEWPIDDLPVTIYNYILAKAKLQMLVNLAYDANKERTIKEEIAIREFQAKREHLRFTGANRLSVGPAQNMLSKQPTR